MRYLFELSAEQYVYLENLGDQARVTTSSSSSGQQQQSSSSLQTGTWTVPPEAFRAAIGVVVRLHTAQGERFLHIQGGRLSLLSDASPLAEAQSIPVQAVAHVPETSLPSMPPMQPMAPMTMDNMQMGQNAMSMQMGNMRLSMTPIARSQDNRSQDNRSQDNRSQDNSPASQSGASGAPAVQRKFCSQCGVGFQPSDRFCANCGHRLD
ncbi:MAG: zinc ribbon domain-containing protein [Tildeniella nuda ZEHNDER 1965/U140]|jgi:hypothetical protein|nr:zinc ribbon domain-containing protein [Tildeniella nuda ZEHNDER 1965/U140]